jgi:hypothetical protein
VGCNRRLADHCGRWRHYGTSQRRYQVLCGRRDGNTTWKSPPTTTIGGYTYTWPTDGAATGEALIATVSGSAITLSWEAPAAAAHTPRARRALRAGGRRSHAVPAGERLASAHGALECGIVQFMSRSFQASYYYVGDSSTFIRINSSTYFELKTALNYVLFSPGNASGW